MIKSLYWTEENKHKGQKLATIAAELGTTAAVLAIAWALRHPAVTSVILGTSRAGQLEENLAAVELEIPDELVQRLEDLYPAPPNLGAP